MCLSCVLFFECVMYVQVMKKKVSEVYFHFEVLSSMKGDGEGYFVVKRRKIPSLDAQSKKGRKGEKSRVKENVEGCVRVRM